MIISDRKVTLIHNTEQVTKSISKGCPQGSACGPGYWNILIDDIFDIPLPKGSRLICFADDCLLMISDKNTYQLKKKANKILRDLVDWTNRNKLNFNPDKSKLMLVTRKLKFKKPEISLDGITLNYVTQFKYLGCILDSKFSWYPHLKYVLGRAYLLVSLLKRVAGLRWGLYSDTIHTIYNSVLLPQISYACPVWLKALDKIKVRKLLLSFQRRLSH